MDTSTDESERIHSCAADTSSTNSTAETDRSCGICLENFRTNGTSAEGGAIAVTHCLHMFCYMCIVTWYQQQTDHMGMTQRRVSCPQCRTLLVDAREPTGVFWGRINRLNFHTTEIMCDKPPCRNRVFKNLQAYRQHAAQGRHYDIECDDEYCHSRMYMFGKRSSYFKHLLFPYLDPYSKPKKSDAALDCRLARATPPCDICPRHHERLTHLLQMYDEPDDEDEIPSVERVIGPPLNSDGSRVICVLGNEKFIEQWIQKMDTEEKRRKKDLSSLPRTSMSARPSIHTPLNPCTYSNQNSTLRKAEFTFLDRRSAYNTPTMSLMASRMASEDSFSLPSVQQIEDSYVPYMEFQPDPSTRFEVTPLPSETADLPAYHPPAIGSTSVYPMPPVRSSSLGDISLGAGYGMYPGYGLTYQDLVFRYSSPSPMSSLIVNPTLPGLAPPFDTDYYPSMRSVYSGYSRINQDIQERDQETMNGTNHTISDRNVHTTNSYEAETHGWS